MARYRATSEGNKPFTAEEELAQDAIDAEYTLGALQRAKGAKIAEIKATTDITIPVAVGTSLYNGGMDSAGAIKAGIDFAAIKNETEVGIWDIDDVVTVMPLADAMAVVVAIGEEYRIIMYERQSRIAAVNAIIIDINGTYPTYEDAKTALDLI